MSNFEHDGCKGCKYEECELDDFPCSACRGTVVLTYGEYKTRLDRWEPMPE